MTNPFLHTEDCPSHDGEDCNCQASEALPAAQRKNRIMGTKAVSWHKIFLLEAAWGRDMPRYLGTSGGRGSTYRQFDWVIEPHLALKFSDFSSADHFAEALRHLRPELFPSIVPFPRPTEHIFFDNPNDRGTLSKVLEAHSTSVRQENPE